MSHVNNALLGNLTRNDFPNGFLFGSASSAFQYEGASDVDGRGQSIWDTFLKKNYPELIAAHGLDAVEFYYLFENDIKMMKELGINTFRFSISWPRVLPSGRRIKGPNGEVQGVNKSGIDFYHHLINTLLENDIEPNVTLFHWDLPQPLEDEYLGFLNKRVVDDFVDYADLCFSEFGDKVKIWLTFNETWTFSIHGYLVGNFPPGRGSSSQEEREAIVNLLPGSRGRSTKAFERSSVPKDGNPRTEPYIVTHHQLLAHAAAVKLYRKTYQSAQKGKIGLGVVSIWAVPHSDTDKDKAAAERTLDFMLGWLMEPIVYGKYPDSMRKLVGKRLPEFHDDEIKDLIGSYDIIGMNYYTTNSVADFPPPNSTTKTIYNPDSQAICYNYGQKAGSSWVYVYPEGLVKLLEYVKTKYKNPTVYITENGIDEDNDDDKKYSWEVLYDFQRISYMSGHINAIKQALSEGADVRGYYTWSFLDNLEWTSGFDCRFGLNYVSTGKIANLSYLERYPRLSAGWYKFFLEKSPLKK